MDTSRLFNEFVRFAKLDHSIPIESISQVANIQMQMDTRIPKIESISKNIPGYSPKAMTPYILEERKMNVTAMDVFSRLMVERIIFLGMPIDDQVANIVIAQLLFLNSVDQTKDIGMYINSPGGSVSAGLAIIDTMNFIKPHVSTICTGMAASMGAMILMSGEKGNDSSCLIQK